jgi:hypothetical protein
MRFTYASVLLSAAMFTGIGIAHGALIDRVAAKETVTATRTIHGGCATDILTYYATYVPGC